MGIGVTCIFLKKKMEENPGKWTWKSIAWAISFRNMFDLRDRLSESMWMASVGLGLLYEAVHSAFDLDSLYQLGGS